MSTSSAVANGIAQAERRIDAMQVLCEILSGQLKGERRQLEEIKTSLASPALGQVESGPSGRPDIGPEMLV